MHPWRTSMFRMRYLLKVMDFSTLTSASLRLTNGMPKGNIKVEDVQNQVSINFEVQSMKDRAPVPQFIINGREYNSSRIIEKQFAATGTEWTLTSNMNYFHPFHIHVNPFQVMSMHGDIKDSVPIGNVTLEEAVFQTNIFPLSSFGTPTRTPMWRDTGK